MSEVPYAVGSNYYPLDTVLKTLRGGAVRRLITGLQKEPINKDRHPFPRYQEQNLL